LSGGYRKFLARPAEVSGVVKAYSEDTEQLVQTDLERIVGSGLSKAAEGSDSDEKSRLAVILRMQLGSSQYATIALRELLKSGGVKQYSPEFGRELLGDS
jgi:tRNA pseudouridine13 synthase